MATLTSVNALKTSIAQAERQVQRDLSQVQQDSARLDQSQAQLARDQQRLNGVQQESRTAQAATSSTSEVVAPRLDRAVQTQAGKVPAPAVSAPAPPKAQLNAQGQTIGTLINIQV